MPATESDSAATWRKNLLRAQIRATRAARSDEARSADRSAIASAVTQWCATNLAPGSLIAAYVPLGSEPLSVQALSQLSAAGHDLIVPVTLPDNDLQWRNWDGDRHLGLDAVHAAALVLVPAFAVDPRGRRLGRGAGCYDRALTRTDPSAVTAAVLYQDELVDEVPADTWDVAVKAVFSPSGFGVRPVRD